MREYFWYVFQSIGRYDASHCHSVHLAEIKFQLTSITMTRPATRVAAVIVVVTLAVERMAERQSLTNKRLVLSLLGYQPSEELTPT